MDKIKITIDLKNGRAFLARVFPNERKQTVIAEAEFIKDTNQFTITDVFIVNREYRNMGYGSMLMYTLMGVAKAEKKVIVLFALVQSLPFYLKCGFLPIQKFANGRYRGKRLRVANSNPKKTFRSQIGKGDLVWIPPNVDNVSVYL